MRTQVPQRISVCFAIYIFLQNDPIHFERKGKKCHFSNKVGRNLDRRHFFNICFVNIASGTNERNRGIGNQLVHHTTVYKYVLLIRHLDDMFLLCMHRGLDVLEQTPFVYIFSLDDLSSHPVYLLLASSWFSILRFFEPRKTIPNPDRTWTSYFIFLIAKSRNLERYFWNIITIVMNRFSIHLLKTDISQKHSLNPVLYSIDYSA